MLYIFQAFCLSGLSKSNFLNSNFQFSCMATAFKLGRSGLVLNTGCPCMTVQTSRGPTLTLKRTLRTSRALIDAKAAEPTVGIPYSKLTVGVPKESFSGIFKKQAGQGARILGVHSKRALIFYR